MVPPFAPNISDRGLNPTWETFFLIFIGKTQFLKLSLNFIQLLPTVKKKKLLPFLFLQSKS